MFAASQGWIVEYGRFDDVGISGATLDQACNDFSHFSARTAPITFWFTGLIAFRGESPIA